MREGSPSFYSREEPERWGVVKNCLGRGIKVVFQGGGWVEESHEQCLKIAKEIVNVFLLFFRKKTDFLLNNIVFGIKGFKIF